MAARHINIVNLQSTGGKRENPIVFVEVKVTKVTPFLFFGHVEISYKTYTCTKINME